MAETVHIPGFPRPVPTWAVGAGLAGVAVAVIYYYRRKKTAAAPAGTATSQYPPDGTVGNPSDPYSTDPATGQTYGNEAAGSGGAYGAYSGGISPTGIIGYDSSGNPVYAPGYNQGGTTASTGGPPFSTNAAWAAWVIAQLTASNTSLDVGALTDAVGLYLNGQPVSAAQKTLVFDAIAIGGDPPVAGANGYPPKVQSDGSKGGGGGGGGSWAYPAPSGLHVVSKAKGGVKISWQPVKGPSGQVPSTYTVTTYDSRAHLVDEFSSGATTTLEFGKGGHGLPKGGYHVQVRANGSPKTSPHATVSFTL